MNDTSKTQIHPQRGDGAMHRASALFPALMLVALALSGCVADPATVDDVTAEVPGTDAATLGPLLARTGCAGYNAITFVDGAAMQPHVPANWTFTSPTGSSELAILRIHIAGCHAPADLADEWAFHLTLSTPMHPDEASTHHHDNPDAVLGAYSNDPAAVANLSAAGVPAALATFTWTEAPTGDTVTVATDTGDVLRLVTLDPHQEPTGSYVWPATYSAGRDDIHWFWGHENASTRPVGLVETTLGPASPVPGITTTQWSVSAWLRFEVKYAAGTPAQAGA